MNQPNGIVFDGNNFYVSVGGLNAIDKITPAGVVSTLASGGTLDFPEGITLGADGNLYTGNRGANHLSEITLDDVATDFAPGVFST